MTNCEWNIDKKKSYKDTRKVTLYDHEYDVSEDAALISQCLVLIVDELQNIKHELWHINRNFVKDEE